MVNKTCRGITNTFCIKIEVNHASILDKIKQDIVFDIVVGIFTLAFNTLLCAPVLFKNDEKKIKLVEELITRGVLTYRWSAPYCLVKTFVESSREYVQEYAC